MRKTLAGFLSGLGIWILGSDNHYGSHAPIVVGLDVCAKGEMAIILEVTFLSRHDGVWALCA